MWLRNAVKLLFKDRSEIAALDEQKLTALLARGENHMREFKRYEDKELAKRQVAITAIAFANTNGGVIFVGVNDDATTQGVGRADLGDAVLSSIADRSRPRIRATVVRIPVALGYVYAIEVPQSTTKPHFLTPDEVAYVRFGATDRRAFRDEIVEMVKANDRSEGSYG